MTTRYLTIGLVMLLAGASRSAEATTFDVRCTFSGTFIRGRIAPRGARPRTGPEKRSAPRAAQRLCGAPAPAAGGR